MFELISNFRPHFVSKKKLAVIRGRYTPFTFSPYCVLFGHKWGFYVT